MRLWITTYLVVLVTYLVIDLVWLGLVSKQSYQDAIGHLMRDSVPVWPWVTFYCVYTLAIVKLVVKQSASKPVKTVFVDGCLFGLAAYGAYNLTNYAILDSWPLMITLTDWGWGTFVSGIISISGTLYLRAKATVNIP